MSLIKLTGASLTLDGNPPAGGAESPTKAVRRVIAEHKVVLFSKSYCPYCVNLKSLLKKNYASLAVHLVELDQNEIGSDLQAAVSQESGSRTVPQLFVGGKFIGGFSESSAAQKAGQLAKVIEAATK
eukprot:TRINITY_DN7549_c0_g1_i2.p1 TRINITY_DN7549_c0_g1~~TRINITY_DN7549_c0_g1_i2.p1  ORF type:complete len:141 (+),score=38.16 TRINITY_DN7549_c0_g1_i2:44-424(+)